MFKIVKKSAWNEQAHEVVTLREVNARLSGDITLVERANVSLRDKMSSMEGFMQAQRTKINACADTKKHLRNVIEEKNAEIKKLKEQLTEAQFQVKVANKEIVIPTSSGLRKPAEAKPAAEAPQKRTYKSRKNGK